MAMKREVVPARLPPEVIQHLDDDVREGRAESRSDAVRKALLAYYRRGSRDA
jgi:Arc/MetJ-type ribon-helix-helix transcriptional regulator